MNIPEDELRIEADPPIRTGGQHVGIISRGAKVTHIPTGFAVICSSERSQLKNKNKAILYLEMILGLEGCLQGAGSLSTTHPQESNKNPGG